MKAFVSSHFSYCPLIWMFHSRKMEHRINSIHKRALKLVYRDSPGLTFQELLAKGKSVSVHQKNPQLLATEIFKSTTGVSLELMNDIFHFVERPCNLRSDYILERKRDHTVYHGSESLSSLAPKLWDLLPNSIKNSASLKEFKTKINTWAFESCPCRICKKYVGRVGFILFKSFHRFCTFGFFMLLLDHLYIIFLNCVSFSDIFSRNQATCNLFNYQRFSILYNHVYIF